MMDLFYQQFAEAPLDTTGFHALGIGVVGRKLRPFFGVCPASHDKEAVGDLVFACLDYEGSGPLQQMPACLEPCDLSATEA